MAYYTPLLGTEIPQLPFKNKLELLAFFFFMLQIYNLLPSPFGTLIYMAEDIGFEPMDHF